MSILWRIKQKGKPDIVLHPLLVQGLLQRARHGVVVIGFSSFTGCMKQLKRINCSKLTEAELKIIRNDPQHFSDSSLPKCRKGRYIAFYRAAICDDLDDLSRIAESFGKTHLLILLYNGSIFSLMDYDSNITYLEAPDRSAV